MSAPILELENRLGVLQHVPPRCSGSRSSVPDNGIVALVGSNGAGKSTLARVVSGLVPVSGGTIRVGRRGRDPVARPPHRPIGSGARPRGSSHLLLAQCRGEPDGVVQPRVGRKGTSEALARAYEAFPVLAERRRQLGGTLSGGQQRILSLAKVLAVPPKLLIVDELSLGLAPVIVDQVYDGLSGHPPPGMRAPGRRAAGGPRARHRRSGRAAGQGGGGVGRPGPRRTSRPRGPHARRRPVEERGRCDLHQRYRSRFLHGRAEVGDPDVARRAAASGPGAQPPAGSAASALPPAGPGAPAQSGPGGTPPAPVQSGPGGTRAPGSGPARRRPQSGPGRTPPAPRRPVPPRRPRRAARAHLARASHGTAPTTHPTSGWWDRIPNTN